ncbi:MAG: VWA domain-containing protein [Planctomycetes bacterium]|nr:VWA domain-containing protein [Planctomycetota bacterium]MCB9903459.1 VWA domain-containing protein [Planctomycetota bacterium]
MKRNHLLGLVLCATLGAALVPDSNAFEPAHPAAPTATLQDVEQLSKALASAGASGTLSERKSALQALVDTADPKAMPAVSQEFARVNIKLRNAHDEAFKARYSIERKEQLVESLEKRAENDKSLEASLSTQREKLRELRDKLSKAEKEVEEYTPWQEALVEGSRALLTAIPASKRKGLEKDAWKALEAEGTGVEDRMASVDLLGYVGSEGTAVSMADLIADLTKESAKLKKKLPKLMADVRKLEARMQKEARDSGGFSSSGPQYERAKAEATGVQVAVLHLAYLCEVAAEAGGRALAREEGAVLDKSTQALIKAQKKGKDGARNYTIALLGHAHSEGVNAALRDQLLAEKDAAARAAMVEALAAAGDETWVEFGLSTLLADESWYVKRSTALALAKLRVRDAIPALIDGIEREPGRTKTDYQEALTSLTGQNYRSNVPLWRRWWEENKETFVVPPISEIEEQASEEAKEALGLTFFGIRTDSERVLFVLDLSGSMDFAMVPRNNPDDDTGNGREPDLPRAGEQSRLEAAKDALKRALGGIGDGAVFNIIFYASDVWSWQDDLLSMTGESRSEAMRYVEDLDAVGGTNIYGALATAFDMAGAESGDGWTSPKIDTIFFLSDGRPSVGLTIDPEEILAYVRDRNQSAGIVIHTIGLSGAQDAYLMRSLAEQNGGTYVAR